MGWLDHSTNNIILDAVLTDYGRQRLATASNTFQIHSYSLADDEVDYRNVKKYGRTVGKEKIEKLTPIFEALTNPSIAIKYKLIGRETNSETTSMSSVYLPVLRLTSPTTSVNLIAGSVGSVSVTVDLVYKNTTGAAIPADMIQTVYSIKVPDRFFKISSDVASNLVSANGAAGLVNAGDPNRIATYEYTAPAGATSITFTITNKPIDNTTLAVYGKKVDSSSNRVINSFVSIQGMKLGTVLDIPVTYKASLTGS